MRASSRVKTLPDHYNTAQHIMNESNAQKPERRRSFSPLDPALRRPPSGPRRFRGRVHGPTPGTSGIRPHRARRFLGRSEPFAGHTTSGRSASFPGRSSAIASQRSPSHIHPASVSKRSSSAAVRGRRRAGPPRGRTTTPFNAKKEDVVPPLASGDIRVIPLGGVEEIGRNMTVVEMDGDIFVIDCGFQFKEIETPGVDYILPNTKYLEDNKERVRALFITHGHLDHIGGLPFLIDRIGMPPIYTRNLTAIMVKKRQAEFPHIPPLDIRIVEKNQSVTIGRHTVRFFGVTHTIPDSMGILFTTPYGNIVVPSDYKLDQENGIPSQEEEDNYRFLEEEHNLLLMLDSTNVEQAGFSTPEKYVEQGMRQYLETIKGRVIIGTFASQLQRLIKVIEIAESLGKKIIVEGRSMKTNIEIAKQAGMLSMKEETIIPAGAVGDYPKDKIVILSTGAQGEEFAAMMRMANKTHKFLQIEKNDTVILSSSIIPGNEKSVEKLKDNIARQGAHIISYRTSDIYVHSTGHGNRGELEWLHRKVRPKFFIPIHGNHYRLCIHADLARELGMSDEQIVVPDNSSIVEIRNKGTAITKLPVKAPSGTRVVDGLTVGDMQEVVMKDRMALADDGMFVVIALINTKTGRLRKSPDIISRGFVYLRESQDLLQETRMMAKSVIERAASNMNPINFDFIRKELGDEVTNFLYQKTNKNPIVIPVLIGL